MTDERTSGVYLIRCKVNGMVYIGQSNNINNRFLTHTLDLITGRHSCTRMLHDAKKLGHKIFSLEVYKEINSKPERLSLESKLINEWRSLGIVYNNVCNTSFCSSKRQKRY